MHTPVSTYRLQLHKDYNFKKVRELIPYLKEMGISTVYASPLFLSRPGSTHGYDVLDPFKIDPEIGTMEELREIRSILKENNMTWIQDIVPNHMAFDYRNPWVYDVLKNGESSRYAYHFDINWNYPDPELKGKVMLPFLGGPLEEVIKNGELKLEIKDGAPHFRYYENWWPLNRLIAAEDIEAINKNERKLEELLDEQHYRPMYWRTTEKKINYRRFFTINELICLTMQREEVFEEYHQFIKQLINEDLIQGLRIDHIDGLFDPTVYLQRLRDFVGEEVFITVEKILEWEEQMPREWPIQGTTGYEFLSSCSQLFTAAENRSASEKIYTNAVPDAQLDWETMMIEKKLFILCDQMQGELDYLFSLLKKIRPDASLREREALAIFLAAFPVYCVYDNDFPLKQKDKNIIIEAYERTKDFRPGLKPELMLLEKILIGTEETEERIYFLMRMQQLTAPLAAKGIEDTAFYNYNVLISHNEVGDSPATFGLSAEGFHQRIRERQERWPLSINATATHDTKRGEDARHRINVISEAPHKWQEHVERWFMINKKHRIEMNGKVIPDANEEYFLYQSLIGAFPVNMNADENFQERMKAYLVKALREEKTHTSWSAPEEEYEQAVCTFLSKILKDKEFTNAFIPFAKEASHFGMLNSLSQLLLKITAPGIPDVYQGCELWDFSLVDPDNRRPVDYELRKRYLNEMKNIQQPEKYVQEILKTPEDARIKFYTAFKVLTARKMAAGVFLNGEYLPLEAKGALGENMLAFARRQGEEWFITVVPKLVATKPEAGEWPLGKMWQDTTLTLPSSAPAGWANVFTGKALEADEGGLLLADVLRDFPVALLKSRGK